MPKTEFKKLEGCWRQIRVEVEPDKVRDAWEKILAGLQKEAQLPGFRKGKAPLALVRNHFDEHIQRELLNQLVPETYQAALEEHGLKPVADPRINDLELTGEKLNYTAVFEVAPEVSLESYSGLTLDNRKELNEAELDQALEEVLARNPQLQAQARDLKVRENLRENLRRRMELQIQSINERQEDERIIDQLLERAALQPPEGLVKNRTMELVRHELSHQPDFKEKTLEAREKLVKELMEKLQPLAEREVKASFVLSEVAAREKVEVTDADIDNRIDILARISGQDQEEFKHHFDAEHREDLRAQLQVEKTLALLKKRALLIEKPRIVKA